MDSRTVSYYFVGYAERSRGYKFYNPTTRSFFKTGNARFLEEVEFGGEGNVRNVVFEEPISDNDQVIVLVIVQETNPAINNDDQTIIPDIIQEQDNIGIPPQAPILGQTQQPQEVPLRRSTRERRSAISNDYIIFLQEHEDDI